MLKKWVAAAAAALLLLAVCPSLRAETVYIVYHANGGTGTDGATTFPFPVQAGSNITTKYASELGLTRAGYRFIHWSDHADGSGYIVNEDTLYGPINTIWYLYAQWEYVEPTSVTHASGTVNGSKVQLTWDAAPYATGYRVQRAVSGGSYTLLADNLTTNSYTDVGPLLPGTNYLYQILTLNGARVSLPVTVQVYFPATNAPSMPSGFSPALVNTSSVSFTWNPQPYVDTYYISRTDATGTTIYGTISASGSATSATYTGLSNGTHYFRMRAYNSAGFSDYTPVVNATVTGNGPVTPTGLKVVSVTDTTVSLQWNRNTDGASYLLYRINGGVTVYIATLANSTTSYTVTGLSGGTSYPFVLYATLNNKGVAADPVTALTRPAAPTNLQVTAGADSLTVSWTAPSGSVTGYTVRLAGGKSEAVTVSGTSHTFTGLTPDTDYQVTVCASNASGTGPLSGAVSARTAKAQAPEETPNQTSLERPTGLTAASNGSSSISLTWNAVAGAAGYRILRSLQRDSGYTEISTTSGTSYTDKQLQPGTTYYYRVTAYAGGVQSGESDTAEARTDERKVPATPEGLRAAFDGNSVSVSWRTSEEATGYRVYRSGTRSGTFELVAEVTGVNRWTDDGADPVKGAWYCVSAFNEKGESEKSAPVEAVPDADSQQMITIFLYADSVTSNSVRLYWDAVDGAAGYCLYRSLSESGEYETLCETDSLVWYDSGLTPSETYIYMLTAFSESGEDFGVSDLLMVTLSAAPPALELRLASSSSSKVQLEWDSVAGADGYRVERSLYPDTLFSEVTSTADTRFTDSNLDSSTEYYYRVVAFTKEGDITVSNVVKVRTSSMTPLMKYAIACSGSLLLLTFIFLLLFLVRKRKKDNRQPPPAAGKRRAEPGRGTLRVKRRGASEQKPA